MTDTSLRTHVPHRWGRAPRPALRHSRAAIGPCLTQPPEATAVAHLISSLRAELLYLVLEISQPHLGLGVRQLEFYEARHVLLEAQAHVLVAHL